MVAGLAYYLAMKRNPAALANLKTVYDEELLEQHSWIERVALNL